MAMPPMTVEEPQPFTGASMIDHSTITSPAIESTAPIGSSRGAAGSFEDGRRNRPATRAKMVTGTLIRNTEPHQKCWRRKPPRIGPIALPPPATAAHTPMARARSFGSWNTLVSSERVAGMISAAPMPMKARVKISIVAEVAKADANDPMQNRPRPVLSAPLRPKRSPRLPVVRSSPANTRV